MANEGVRKAISMGAPDGSGEAGGTTGVRAARDSRKRGLRRKPTTGRPLTSKCTPEATWRESSTSKDRRRS